MSCCYLNLKNICMLNNKECELETPDDSMCYFAIQEKDYETENGCDCLADLIYRGKKSDGFYEWEEYYCPDCGNTYRYLQLSEEDEDERD